MSVEVATILEQLDRSAADYTFPDLNHGYFYALDARMHAFSDAERWALVVETVGYNPRAFNVVDVLHVFGNALTSGAPGCGEGDFLDRVDNMDDVEDPDEPEEYAGGTPVVVRGTSLDVVAGPDADLVDVFRAVVPPHRDLFLADEAELRRRIPADLPQVLTLEEWHQPDLLEGPPSAAEVYRLVAQVLATGDPSLHRPTLEPNTHWSNWPESGGL